MRVRVSLVVLRIATLVALLFSSALLVDYTRVVPSFCEAGSGCAKVRASDFSHIVGVPVPVIGVVGLLCLFTATLVPHPLARLGARIMAIFGALAGGVFLVIQEFVIGAFCKLCVVVDTFALVAGVAGLLVGALPETPKGGAGPGTAGRSKDAAVAWGCAALLAALVPFGWARAQPTPPAPEAIRALMTPGKLNVIEFADFECPFCRRLHPILKEVIRSQGDRVRVVRQNVPLPSHRHARGAARAYYCGEQLGFGEAMADALFAAEDLSPAGCASVASSLGIPLPAFEECVAKSATDAAIKEQIDRFRGAGLAGLPTVFVGDRVLIGLQPEAEIRKVFAAAQESGGGQESIWFALVAVGVLGFAVSLFFGVRRTLRSEDLART